MANVYLQITFELERSREISILLSEFIKANASPRNLEILLKDGIASIFYEPVEEEKNSEVKLGELFQNASSVNWFWYDVSDDPEERERKKQEFLRLVTDTTTEVIKTEEEETRTSSDLSDTKDKKETSPEPITEIPTEAEKGANPEQKNASKTDKTAGKQILELINSLPDGSEGVDAKYIATVLKMNPRNVSFHLTNLSRGSKIRRVERGKYHKVSAASKENLDKPEQKNPVEGGAPAVEPPKEEQLKDFKDLEEIPIFRVFCDELTFKDTRDENISKALNVLFSFRTPSEEVKQDLLVRSTLAVVIVPESLNWNTISLNLEHYDTGVTEDTKKKAEEYLIEVFSAQGYSVSYIKFLHKLNRLFKMRYRDPEMPFPLREAKTRVKMPGLCENQDFEEFLGEIAEKKRAGAIVMRKILTYMGSDELEKTEYDNILELFQVSYGLKKINQDFLMVNGNYTMHESKLIPLVKMFINRFVVRISNGTQSEMQYIDFLKELNEAIKSKI